MRKSGDIIEINEYKALIKDMLAYVHKICIENDIRYFVAYGTLIGTIRHSGFIPWDDDIDIWIVGEDYPKFVDIFSKSTTDYYIISPDNSLNYYNLMTRICSKAGILKMRGVINIENLGPFIDVLPLYKAPEDREERLKYFEEIRQANIDVRCSLPLRYSKTRTIKGRIKSCIDMFSRIHCRIQGTEAIKKKRSTLVTKYEKTNSNVYYDVFELRYSFVREFTGEEINNIEYHKFEDIEVAIPSAYDKILRDIFGDYMKLPPEEERKSHHHFVPYWK